MEEKSGFSYSSDNQNRVLITQLPDDDVSFTQSEDDVTSHQNRTVDSPILEDEAENSEGNESDEEKYNRLLHGSTSTREKTDSYSSSKDKTGSYADNEDHVTVYSHVTSKKSTTERSVFEEVASDEDARGDNDEDEVGEYADSMSMGEVSSNYSETYEPPQLRDEDFDTDLEMDDDKYLNPEKYDHDTTGLTKYLDACRQHEVTPVRYFIRNMMAEHMNLSYYGLGPVAMKALSVPLEFNTTIERLELEGNWMMTDGVKHLCHVLKENVYVSHLNLADNKMGNEGSDAVCELLLENRTLELVDVTGNQIADGAAETIGSMLRKNSTLRQLKLRHNHLEDVGAGCLKEALSENESLEVLDVSWNHFQRRGCVMIAEGLKENVGLKDLSVSMNGFGLEGAIALGEAIRVNRTLQHLDASYCRLPLEGAPSLAQGLQANDTLQTLNLGYNSLGPEGTYLLLQGVEKNECSSLKLLDFGNTMVTQAFKDLQDKLESERSLRVLHGGVMLDTRRKPVEIDPMEAFKQDPMTKLKEWVAQAGYRLIDLLRHFDRDNNFTVSRQEFIRGIKAAGIDITDVQIEILMRRLDKDGNGEIDFSELVQGDNEHRALKRQLKKTEEERKRMRDELEQADLDSFLRDPPTLVTMRET